MYQKRLANGKICWIKHRDKGFLPKDYTSATKPVNQISFPLADIPLSQEGDFEYFELEDSISLFCFCLDYHFE